MSKQRTITLTGRPPVTIREDDWPVVAAASAKVWDNQYEFQANRTEKSWIRVRQHQDGRAIVYAGYDYDTAYQNERDAAHKAGQLIAEASPQVICDAILEVAAEMPAPQMLPDGLWDSLAAEAIADMPAEVLD